MRPIDVCAREFIDRLRAEGRRRPFDVCDEATWLGSSIIASQGAGNPQGSRLVPSERLRELIDELLKAWRKGLTFEYLLGYHQFEHLAALSFASCHILAERVDPGCWLPFGRIQKIHNIWLKYHIALYFSGYSPAYTAANAWIGRLLSLAHVPIDREVLKHLQGMNGVPQEVTHLGAIPLSWKRDLQVPRYLALQDCLREIAHAAACDSSLHYEMDNIWVAEDD